MEKKKTILLAEDQADQREMLQLLLESAGYKVYTASDGIRTLQHLKKRQFDLVLLDIMMPKVDGVAICDKLKHARGRMRTPVIIISALAEGSKASEDVWRDRTLADAFVAKPFDTRELLKLIAELAAEPLSSNVARAKYEHHARLRDVRDLIHHKDPMRTAKLQSTHQEISTQYMHRPTGSGGTKS